MNVLQIRTLAGPNVYHHKPVLRMTLDLAELAEVTSCDVPHFIDRLLTLLPGLREHHCSPGYPGGFVERLQTGTYFGHITEHIALALSELAGIGVTYGKTLGTDTPGVYSVVVRYTNEQGMRQLLHTAVALVHAVLANQPFPLAERVTEARAIIERTELGPSTAALVAAAERRQIPWARIGEQSLIQLGYGVHRTFLQATVSSRTSYLGVDIAQDKALTKMLLRRAGLPVPSGTVVHSREEALSAFAELGAPVVIKPVDGNQGKGVSLNLSTPTQVQDAFDAAQQYANDVMVEQQFRGHDYRVVVVNGAVVAASRRTPAQVIGNGCATISELIARENANPLRGDGHCKPLSRITIDGLLVACLQRQDAHLEAVPQPGQIVCLRESANLSTGGTAVDVTDQVHSDVRWLCERTARVIGLDICGIDIVLPDIAAPFTGAGGIIEVNAAPGIRMHHFPTQGKPRDVGGAIVDMLYPPNTPSRIPIFSVTGTNGKTTVVRMISHVLAASGQCVGMTTTDGIFIGGRCVTTGDTSGPQSARVVLSDPTVEAAVLETARGGIVRRGLGYDWADIAVLTNIHEDHIGQDDINSIEDIVHIKSLVAERVREGGTLILNAENDPVAELASSARVRRTSKQIVYFSLTAQHPRMRQHLRAGGAGYYVKNGWIVEAQGISERPIVATAAIPATLHGLVEFHVANAVAAVAACRAHGLAPTVIAAALQSFDGVAQNMGRANLYRVGRGYVFVDYGHNADAFAAIGRMTARLSGYRLTGVLNIPGDRAEWVIAHAGQVAAHLFHRVILWDSEDLRGQPPGAIPRLLCDAIARENPHCECRIILDHQEAMDTALHNLHDDDCVFLFYDDLAAVRATLQRHGATPVSTLPLQATSAAPPEAHHSTSLTTARPTTRGEATHAHSY